MREGAKTFETSRLGVKIPSYQEFFGTTYWTCEKWSGEATNFIRKKLGLEKFEPVTSQLLRKIIGSPEEIVVVDGNLMLNEGIQLVLDLMMGAAGTPYNNANSRIGIGDSSAAEDAAQTDLQAAANKTYKGMNAGFPSRAAQTVTFQADFLDADANYDWAEWVIDNGAAPGKTLNRKVAVLGTKATGTWTMGGEVTLS